MWWLLGCYLSGFLFALRFCILDFTASIEEDYDNGRRGAGWTPGYKLLAFLVSALWPPIFGVWAVVVAVNLFARAASWAFMKVMFPRGIVTKYAKEKVAKALQRERAQALRELDELAVKEGLRDVPTIMAEAKVLATVEAEAYFGDHEKRVRESAGSKWTTGVSRAPIAKRWATSRDRARELDEMTSASIVDWR